MKKILKKAVMLLCAMVITIGFIGQTTVTSNADIFKGRLVKYDSSKVNTVYFYVDGEAIKDLKPITQWAGASSKLKLVKTDKKNKAKIVIYNKKKSDKERAGTTRLYNSKGQLVNHDKNWSRAEVHIFKNNYTKNKANYNHTLAHEVGHALGIAHTTVKNSSIMKAGADPSSKKKANAYCITSYDKKQLQKKWGK